MHCYEHLSLGTKALGTQSLSSRRTGSRGALRSCALPGGRARMAVGIWVGVKLVNPKQRHSHFAAPGVLRLPQTGRLTCESISSQLLEQDRFTLPLATPKSTTLNNARMRCLRRLTSILKQTDLFLSCVGLPLHVICWQLWYRRTLSRRPSKELAAGRWMPNPGKLTACAACLNDGLPSVS